MEKALEKINQKLVENPDSYTYNLYVALQSCGKLTECNPYKNDPKFLRELASLLEESDMIEVSLGIKRRLKQAN